MIQLPGYPDGSVKGRVIKNILMSSDLGSHKKIVRMNFFNPSSKPVINSETSQEIGKWEENAK